jgi:hypothetical protein
MEQAGDPRRRRLMDLYLRQRRADPRLSSAALKIAMAT